MADRYAGRTLREIIRVIAGRFVDMLGILAVVVIVTWVATALAPKWYRSETQLLAAPGRSLSPLESPATALDRIAMFVTTQRQVVTSEFVIASALMRLEGRPMLEDHSTQWYSDAQIRKYIRQRPRWVQAARRQVKVVMPGGDGRASMRTFKIQVDWPERRRQAAEAGVGSRQFAARRAYLFANYLLEAYQMRYRQLETLRAKRTARFMAEKSLALAKADLDEAEKAYSDFIEKQLKGDLRVIVNFSPSRAVGAETGVASLQTRFQSQLKSIDVRLSEVRVLKAQVDGQLARAEATGGDVTVPDAVTSANPLVKKLQGGILDLKLAVNRMAQRFTDEYQALKDLRADLAKTRAELIAELRRQSERLGQQIEGLQAQRAALERIVSSDRKRVDKLASLAAQYERLQRNLAAAQKRYDLQRDDVFKADRARRLAEIPIIVDVMDGPSVPDPDKPRRPILLVNVLLAAIAGIVLAFVYAFIADHFDHSIKGIDDCQRYLGLPVLASVPKLAGRIIYKTEQGRVELHPRAAEVYRGLWASLFYSGRAAGNSILVCSNARGEGATVTACGLALAGSQSAAVERVALVDFNLRAPSVHELLEIDRSPGVGEIISGGVEPLSAARRIDDALDVFTVGEVGMRMLEVLRGDALHEFLNVLADRYDRVIVDAAAANQYPDAQVIAGATKQVLLVARTGQTPREAVAQASRSLESSGANLLGVVLNMRTYPIPRFLYRRL